jgi:hypothetical protein
LKGWTYLHSRDQRKALASFTEALRLDPSNDWARNGLIEALKARNPIYRAILAWYLFADRLSPRARWAVIIGSIVGFRALSSVLRRDERLWPLAALLVLTYLSVTYLTWVGVPLFNLLLLLDRLGRHALSREQRASALLFSGSLVHAVVLGGVMLLLGHRNEAVSFSAAAVLLGIPLSAATQMSPGTKRVLTATFVAAGAAALLVAGVLLAAGLAQEDGAPVGIAVALIAACLISTWGLGPGPRS